MRALSNNYPKPKTADKLRWTNCILVDYDIYMHLLLINICNTSLALCGFLTGVPFSELPNALRGTPNASTVDNWPWIWKDYKQAGYKTMFVQDVPENGAFQYRMLGFKNQQTDFYGRKISNEIEAPSKIVSKWPTKVSGLRKVFA